MNKVLDKLPALVAEELAAANDIHSFFHSPHEGYAVLLEEVEEAHAEMINVELGIRAAWECVKDDDMRRLPLFVRDIEKDALRLAAEAIQVAAMARKMQESAERCWRE